MLEINIQDQSDLKSLEDNVNFQAIKAMSRLAYLAASDVRQNLPKKFTLRNGFVSRGIKYVKATKAKPYAEVYSQDSFMVKQEEGGQISKRSHRFSIPTGIRQSSSQLVPRRLKAGKILDREYTFKKTINGRTGIFQKQGTRLKSLYLLRPVLKFQPRWNFYEDVQQSIANHNIEEYL